MESARVTSKGQITIPLSVRKDLRLREGDTVAFEKIGDGYVIKSFDTMTLGKLKENLGELADILHLNSIEDVANVIKDLHESYVQSEQGNVIDGKTALTELRAKYEI